MYHSERDIYKYNIARYKKWGQVEYIENVNRYHREMED